jgi:hypothetical protein
VVVQKPRRPRKAKEGTGKEAMANGSARNAGTGNGTGTRFDILGSINEDPAIAATNNEDRIARDTQKAITPNPAHGKGKGNNGKKPGDKKGKTAGDKAVNETVNKNIPSVTACGTPEDLNKQNSQGNNLEVMSGRGNQGNHVISQRQVINEDHHEIIRQAPQQMQHEVNAGTINHMGPHHTPRPPELGLSDPNFNITNGPDIHSEDVQAQSTNGDDMDVVLETPNLDQEAGGAKSMILA